MRSVQTALYPLLLLFFLTGSAGADWRSCLSVSDDDQRLSCYDHYARSLNKEIATQAVSAENDFGKAPVTPAKDVDSIEAVIVKVEYRNHGKRALHLDNGQSWIQVDSSSQPKLKSGEAIRISRGALGSFVLKKQNSNRRLRVKRLN